jgi:hypothetical protein
VTEKEMRELTEETPDIGRELQHSADALNADTSDLAKQASNQHLGRCNQARLLEFVLGVSQGLCDHPLFGFGSCTPEHAPEPSYPDAKTLNINHLAGWRWPQPELCEFQRSSRKGLLDRRR